MHKSASFAEVLLLYSTSSGSSTSNSTTTSNIQFKLLISWNRLFLFIEPLARLLAIFSHQSVAPKDLLVYIGLAASRYLLRSKYHFGLLSSYYRKKCMHRLVSLCLVVIR